MIPANESLFKSIGAGLFVVIGMQLGVRILENFLPFEFALALAMIIICTVNYPLFVRGTVNTWTKDKRNWTFWSHFVTILLFSIVIFMAARLLFSKHPADTSVF